MYQAILFDLDGTLLPMDMDVFMRSYFGLLGHKMAPHGYDPNMLSKSIWAGTNAMIRNNGICTNEEAFWNVFTSTFGTNALSDKSLFEDFYANEFQTIRETCGFQPLSNQVISLLKKHNVRRVLATNPVFPAIATESRIRWAGLDPTDFELVTTYENIGYSKPNPEYFREILQRQGLQAEHCLMVGNDLADDLPAAEAGIPVYIITDCLINKAGLDLAAVPHGSFRDFAAMLQAQLNP